MVKIANFTHREIISGNYRIEDYDENNQLTLTRDKQHSDCYSFVCYIEKSEVDDLIALLAEVKKYNRPKWWQFWKRYTIETNVP